MTQYAERTAQPQAIELTARPAIHATLRQAEKFFAMTSDWGGGALRGHGELMKILQSAAERGSVVKLELLNPHLEFRSSLEVTIRDAGVIRATDEDLR